MSAIVLTRSTRVDVPAADAWALVSDYTRDPAWRTGVQAMTVSPSGPLVEGATTDEQLRLVGKTYRNLAVITAVDPGAWFSWRTTEGAEANGSRRVEPLGPSSCVVRLALEATPHGFDRLTAPILRRLLARNLERDLATLRRMLERSTSTVVGR